MGRKQYPVRVSHMLTFSTSFRTLQAVDEIMKRGCGHLLMPSHFCPDLATVCHEFCKIKFDEQFLK